MKVLFVSSGNSHYGIVPFIRNQGESLREAGLDLDFYTVVGKGIKGYLQNISRLRKVIRENSYDVVHAHYSLIGLVTLLTFTRTPVVLSVMGSDAYGDYDTKGKRIPSSYFYMMITQIIQPFVKGIIVKSKNIEKYIYRRRITKIIPNGVNFTKFAPGDMMESRKKLSLPLDKKLVLFLAKPDDPRKNFKLLLEAEKLIETKDFEVLNPYPIDNKVFPDYLNACNVFVLTSYNEGSPNVIKEAMACNTPILATPVGDVVEVLGDTPGCYIIDFDPEDVAEKLKKALAFNRKTTGRKTIKDLDDRIVSKNIISIYKKAINPKE
ncbi:MAG: glycosyltransferase family 4 protein [bacterium]|jgi:teichuronic acid biosynthesis glycosyltransferase TuaC